MHDIREIVLYFKEGCPLVPIDIAKGLSDRFKDLLNPKVLTPEETDEYGSLVIFEENPEIMLTVTQMTVNLVVSDKYFDEINTFIFDLVDLFDEFKIGFTKIGLVYTIVYSEDHKKLAKSKMLNVDSIPDDIEDFNLSFYRKVKTKSFKEINVWERLFTNTERFNELVVQFDFNTFLDKELDMKSINEFVNNANSYSEERSNY